MLEPACVIKLASLACTLLAAGSHAFDFEFASHLFEAGDRTGEAASAFRETHSRDVAGKAVERLRRHIERDYDRWLTQEFRSDPAGLADARAAIASFDFVLPGCLPDAATVVAAKYDPQAIAALVVRRAGAGDEKFRVGPLGAPIGARILHCLVQHAYEELRSDRAFCDATEVPFREAVLTDLDTLKRGQEQAAASLSEMEARLLASIEAQTGAPRAVLGRVLEGFGELAAEMDAAHLEERLRAKALEYRELRERLDSLTNDDQRVQALRQKAGAQIGAGDFATADATLSEAERLDLMVIEELESLAERRRASAASTRAERAATARLRLDYRAESAHYHAAGEMVANDPAAAWTYRLREASALGDHGREFGDNQALRDAIAIYRAAMPLAPRAERPLDWADTKNSLGTALTTLGERESGMVRLKVAVAAYRAALKECSRDRVPLYWAVTQNNLGNALSILGRRESGTARLEEAVAAYRAALEEWSRDRVPLDWAGAQNNLGTALTTLGERESGTARLEEAVAACRAALEERTRDRVPLDWATTQNNLGAALWTLGERESGTARLEEAVAAYRAAIEERTRDRVPLDWAMTQYNLAIALMTLGERESGTTRLEEAVAAYRAALEEWSRDRVPLDWASAQNNLGIALRALGERESGTTRLEEAVAACRAALEEWSRDRVPLSWAEAQNNLGTAFRALGERESDTMRLEQAVAAYRAALEERSRDRVPLDWAHSQHGLANALAALAERQKNPKAVEEALLCMRAAADAYQERKNMYWWPIANTRIIAMTAEVTLQR
jgi:tetratricopeptide (TPR) repeat protein